MQADWLLAFCQNGSNTLDVQAQAVLRSENERVLASTAWTACALTRS